MTDKVTELRQTLEQLDRALVGFEIDTAWRRPDAERQAAIRSLCDSFHEQMSRLIGPSPESSQKTPTRSVE